MKTIKELETKENKLDERMVYYYMALKDVLGLIDELPQEVIAKRLGDWLEHPNPNEDMITAIIRIIKEELKSRING